MSHEIDTPSVVDGETGAIIFEFRSTSWSLDLAHWVTDSVVELTLRKYPGDHLPPDLLATIDCLDRTGQVGKHPPVPLAELEGVLDAALSPRPAPAPKPERGVAAALKRLFGMG